MDGPLGKPKRGKESATWCPQDKWDETKKSAATRGSLCMMKDELCLLLPARFPEVFEFVTLVAVETGSVTLV